MVIQTAIMPDLIMPGRFYDFLLPFVICLSLYNNLSEGIPVVIIFGFIMDGLSGCPFWLYSTTYLWLFAGVRGAIIFLHSGSRFFLIIFVFFAVVLENFIFISMDFILAPDKEPASDMVNIVVAQLVWAVLTAPFFIAFYNYIRERYLKWRAE